MCLKPRRPPAAHFPPVLASSPAHVHTHSSAPCSPVPVLASSGVRLVRVCVTVRQEFMAELLRPNERALLVLLMSGAVSRSLRSILAFRTHSFCGSLHEALDSPSHTTLRGAYSCAWQPGRIPSHICRHLLTSGRACSCESA